MTKEEAFAGAGTREDALQMSDDQKEKAEKAWHVTSGPTLEASGPGAMDSLCPLTETPCSIKSALKTALAEAELFQKKWQESLERIKALEASLSSSGEERQTFFENSSEFYIRSIESLKSEKDSLEKEVTYLQQRIYELNDYIQLLYNSYSWKVTAPLRRLWDIFVDLRKRLGLSKRTTTVSAQSGAAINDPANTLGLSPRAQTMMQYFERAALSGAQNDPKVENS